MSELPDKQQKPIRFSRSDLPKRGEWYWVTYGEEEWDEQKQKHVKKEVTHLMCVAHLGSNHVIFRRADSNGGTWGEIIHFRVLLQSIKAEPNWQAILDKEIEAKQKELRDAVRFLADSVQKADMLPEDTEVQGSTLPSTSRVDPEERKKALIHLRDKDLPEAEERIEQITKEMVALQRDLVLPTLIESDRLSDISDHIKDRLFVLELYAGIGEKAERIGSGKPADPETPITIRQMMRFMDEETLIDYDKGGMDYQKLEDFDRWIARPENYTRLLPEPRCVVAFKVRRYHKDYGPVRSIAGAFEQMEKHWANTWTFLLIRNGENIWRLSTEIDFNPGLLPNRDEFHKPFEDRDENGEYDYDNRDEHGFPRKKFRPTEIVTPDDLEYDRHVEQRKKLVFHYNRILFLLQGILDRSKVFRPHPPLNLSDSSVIQQYIKLIYDQQDGLPSANPPVWKEYRDRLNSSIKVGTWVWAKWEEKEWRSWERPGHREHSYWVKRIVRVTSIKKDRSRFRVTWTETNRKRTGWEFPTGWYSGYGKYGDWPMKDRNHHRWVDPENIFNVDAYRPGEYKTFLCDAYLKGAYLEWAPQLLAAEDHWREK